MTINKLIEEQSFAEEKICEVLERIHVEGPIHSHDLEVLAYIKSFHQDLFAKYEQQLISLLGLFYKTNAPQTLIETIYAIYAKEIEEETSRKFTPIQASAYKQIKEKRFFSFSAPTSSGKSYLFREIITEYNNDIIIIVPSRALIAEYMYEVLNAVDKNVLVLPFIENININNIQRRIYIITPERGEEIFRKENNFDIGLFLFDEAQISEENIRGMKFDAFVRRVDKKFPYAKKVFTHPFIENPEAQLKKHNFNQNCGAQNYKQHSVGKIYISYNFQNEKFQYFSPFKDSKKVEVNCDIIEDTINNNGTLLIYISKDKIYKNKHIDEYNKYISLCPKIKDTEAIKLISELKDFIGATAEKGDRYSDMIDMIEHGIVIHHGSIPLKARLIIERFVNNNFAKICFATSTLIQGINMPFDIVLIDNFKFGGEVGDKSLKIKNLIGRAGRSKSTNTFDFGYVIVRHNNVKTFSDRLSESTSLKEESSLDQDISSTPEDLKDITQAIQQDNFDIELQLPSIQVDRLKNENTFTNVEYILDNFINGSTVITHNEYRKLPNSQRNKLKDSFKSIFLKHLRRNDLNKAEKSVLSTAISILIWKIKVKSFSQIVALRHAYLTEKDERAKIDKLQKNKKITYTENLAKKKELKLRFSQVAYGLPNIDARLVSLFENGSSVLDCSYDKIIYDTYDYLDKVIAQSLTNPLCAAFQLYYNEKKDKRALVMKNYIRYGTNDNIEIWLLKYGFEFEDIEWIKSFVESIDANEIIFSLTIYHLSDEKMKIISRFT